MYAFKKGNLSEVNEPLVLRSWFIRFCNKYCFVFSYRHEIERYTTFHRIFKADMDGVL